MIWGHLQSDNNPEPCCQQRTTILFVWWWKHFGWVWKADFSTPWQRAQVRPDHMRPHRQGCSIQATHQFSSRTWGQVNGHSLLTTACHQQLISWACKRAATDLPTFFSPEMLTLEKQGSNCSLKVTWKPDLWPKFISNPSENCSFAIIFQRMPLIHTKKCHVLLKITAESLKLSKRAMDVLFTFFFFDEDLSVIAAVVLLKER